MASTLDLLAGVVNVSDRSHPDAEAHLKAHGYEFVGRRYRSPDECATLPRCKHCGEHYDPDDPDSTSMVCTARFGESEVSDLDSSSALPRHEAEEEG
jgi:hypothetical protein